MSFPGPALGATALAILVERTFGYPDRLYRSIGHPVEWIGQAISRLDAELNESDAQPLEARLRGLITIALLIATTLAISYPLTLWLRSLPGGWIAEALIGSALLAQQSLRLHVSAVAEGLDHSLKRGRAAVSHIVGRDPASLDESAIARAALESLAENASDGVVAPAFWFAVGGLPGIALYKAINTADSMIGHRSKRYRHFGWAAALIDDLANLPASRITGLLFAAAAWTRSREAARAALDVMARDAGKHVSPNAGWPEAALAGALDIRLGGPRSYGGLTVDLATIGSGRAALDRNDIRRGLKLYGRALTLLFCGVLLLAWFF